ncbi:peptidoglycan DD-metalloendopeptidase family protein [candidate division WWE3 bacterium]|nr:peptidoglycan DD-metalloendopeptidase family protein [candidate division WWE3 bacterium]
MSKHLKLYLHLILVIGILWVGFGISNQRNITSKIKSLLNNFHTQVFAQVAEEHFNIGGTVNNEDALIDKIEELKKKVSDLQTQERTLKNEIDYFDAQIDLTELKIQNANAEITKRGKLLEELAADISDLSGRIVKLADSIDYQQNVLNERVRARYKSGDNSQFLVLFGSDSINTLVKRIEYLKILQAQDKKVLDQMQEAKKAFSLQKNLFETKKTETAELKAKVESDKKSLEAYEVELNNLRASKDQLLKSTQNDEAKYQQELEKAKAELDAIQAIVASINFKNGTSVKRGDVIAVMGNSGSPYCSDGAHLHMEVRKNGSVQNAENYLKPMSLYVEDFSSGTKTIGKGKWNWPMKEPTVTQRYGLTPWSRRYPSGKHDGVDMVASNTFIYAPDDGKMVRGGMGCYGAVINYVAIDHGDGVVSYYLHVK